jgi:LysM repeat protein
MAARSPARFLAPVALLAVVLALFLVVSKTATNGGSTGNGSSATQDRSAPAPGTKNGGQPASQKSTQPRSYRVKVGDTPSAIAEKTGVPLSQILELNPNLDPQALAPGQRIKLRGK